jgi:putative transposase
LARPLCIEFPGALYHVTAQGNAQQDIFLDNEDRQRFLGVLARVVSRFQLLLHTYCLMDNHLHLVVETLDRLASSAMRQLNGVDTPSLEPPSRPGRPRFALGGCSGTGNCSAESG